MELNCSRIIIEGHTSFGIQGINLREKIERTIKQPKDREPLDVKGWVKNLKDGRVEIICTGHDVDLLHKTLKDWDEIKHTIKEDLYDAAAARFTDFTVERSDDLSEMVWALRGAGQRFQESTDALERINSTLEKRDKKVAEGRLLTLYYEIIHNKKELDELNHPILSKQKFQLEALRSNIGSPVIPEPSFTNLICEVFIDLRQFHIERQDILNQNLDALLKIVQNELSTHGIKMSKP